MSFIVLMAGPGLRGSEMLLRQQALVAEANGATAAAVPAQTAQSRKVFDAVIASTDPADAKIRVAAALDHQRNLPGASAARPAAVDTVTAPWMYYFLRHDPVSALKSIHVPVLAVAGGLDLQVPPKEDLAIIEQALVGDRDVTVKELPGLNHLFQTAKTGSPREYGSIEETMSPVALKTVGDWVVAHTR